MATINKSFLLVLTVMCLASLPGMAQHQKHGLTWYTDINKVYELSKKTNKPVFAFFTGSDWCGWCHKLEKAVFSKPGFQQWAKTNVILLEVDFPRKKELPQALAEQNNGLQNFFQVQGFPTIWMFHMDKDPKTNKYSISGLGSLGYPRAEAGKEEAAFLTNANAILKNKK